MIHAEARERTHLAMLERRCLVTFREFDSRSIASPVTLAGRIVPALIAKAFRISERRLMETISSRSSLPRLIEMGRQESAVFKRSAHQRVLAHNIVDSA